MNISVHKLMAKMEEELKEAKNSSSERNIAQKVYAIKSLCELILDNSISSKEQNAIVPISNGMIPKMESMNIQPKRVVMDDEANGDSLLDF